MSCGLLCSMLSNNYKLKCLHRIDTEEKTDVGMCSKDTQNLDMVVLTFHLNTQEAEMGDLCEFETSLIYMVSSRTAWNFAM